MATASMICDRKPVHTQTWSKLLFVGLLLVSLAHGTLGSDCILGGYNVTLLSKYNPWLSSSNDGNTTYKISLCEAVKLTNAENDCPHDTSICQLTTGKKPISIGNYTTNVNSSRDSQAGELIAFFRGEPCPDMPNDSKTTIIYFKCGKSLGSPVFLGSMACVVYFEWESHVFCTEKNDVPEVPCYVYHNGVKHDLSPLTRRSGAYLVDSTENRQFYINVCRDITGIESDSSKNCPAGAGACRIVDGKGEDMGRPTDRLQQTVDGNLMLQYRTSSKPENCLDNPTTTITFICPKRGGSKDPLLIEDRLCQNHIEWQTEFACAETTLTSTNCSLSMAQHNVDIDLSPLKKSLVAQHPYKMNVTDGSDHYVYVLNVCDKLGLECPTKSDNAAACQLKEHESSFAKNLGKSDTIKLRLSDGELTLTYKDGSPCHTDFRRNTVITFKCNRTATNGGTGWPMFVKAEECTYFFEWATKYACENHPTQGSCRVDHGQQRYDLSALVRESGGNWVALDGENQNEKNRYYINVCKDVLSTSDTTGCTSTSVCKIGPDGKVKNLGQYTQAPTFDPRTKTIQINYTNGDICGSGKNVMSRVTFICKPGDLESGPILIQETDNECMYEFEWHTAAACVLSKKTGTDCKVFDDVAGYSFDLSQLTKPSGQYYNVTDDKKKYNFFLNVCGAVSGTSCDTSSTNTAVCQVDKSGGSAHKTGEVNKQLTYFDGMLNLTYTNGDPYNNPANTHRQTQIAFLCDPAAGKGRPEFVMETNYTYSFKWYTAYACPTRPVECVYVDKANNRLYDLSRLSMSEKQDNWEVVDDTHPNKLKYYINICRPVSPVHLSTGGACGPFAAVCETQIVDGKETLVHASLGEAKVGPVPDGVHPGQLVLKYTGGDTCVDENGKTTTMTTLIHFDCMKGSVSTGPMPLIKAGLCEYSTIWHIEAACPVDDVVSTVTDCSVKDPNSDFIFNLKPLMKKNEGYYSVNSTDNTRTFRLNICGNVSSCEKLQPDNVKASVCEDQSPSQRKPALAMDNGNLEFSDDGQLTLTYGGKRLANEEQVQVKISFICRRNISVESPVFVRQEEQTYYFQFETALACAPQPVDCVAVDKKGNQYNLNALAKTTSNWMVQDTRVGHTNLKYYINVCRPMNPIAGSTCPGGPVGGCQIGDNSFSLGYVQSKPVAGNDGSLILRYRGGTPCHKGTDKESQRSTRINFLCSTVESDPVFMGETDTCEYLFEWSTPSACPEHRVVGTNCRVTDPVYNFQFNISPLRKLTEDYKVNVTDYTYLINVCGELISGVGDCGGGQGVGACQTKPWDASYLVNAGKANANLTYDAGDLTLRYSDGKGSCHKKYNRTTIITFTCDYSKGGKSGPRFLQEDGDCTYQFEWPTVLACPPYKVSTCMVTGTDRKMYDLTSLARKDDNYIDNEEHKRKKFILNVCQTLVPKKGQACPPNSAACMIDLAETSPEKRYHKIGELSNNPVRIEDGTLLLRYENGEKCSYGNGTVSTVIIMNCDPKAFDTEPTDQFMVNRCEYHFIWTTQAACPVGSQSANVQSGNCTATNPRTGYTFDLSGLRKPTGYPFDDGNGHDFYINVCGSLSNSACGKNVGSCQVEQNGEKRNFSSGIANSNLQYRGGFLMLNYSGGALCHHKYQRSTIINFICSKEHGDGQPILIDETDDCVYQFNWHTSRVCEKEILCSTEAPGKNGQNFTVDLSPLIKTSGHYVAISMIAGSANPQTTYYINICRPLNPIRGKLCPPGSSSCMIEGNKKPVSLGQLEKEPYVDPLNGRVTLYYDEGSKCERDPSRNRTTRIIFTCKVGKSLGEPRFEALVDNCDYVFMWETYLACPENKEVPTPSCTYTNPSTDQKYDISSLKNPVQVPVPSGGYFKLQPCGVMSNDATSGCDGSASCHTNGGKSMSYGTAKTRTFMMESREILKLQFTGGSDCADNTGHKIKAKTEILFQCDYGAGAGKPVHWPTDKCTALFHWKTSLICPAVVEQCNLVHNGILYDLEILSREMESWNYTDSKKNVYYLNLCQGVHGRARGEGCHLDSAVCRKTPNAVVDNLGVVKTQKLYMDDDGETIVLEYSQGDAACSHSRRRSNNPMAKTVIKFKCDKVVGGPRLIENQDNEDKCVFEFEWKTRIACKDGTLTEAVKDKNGVLVDPRSAGLIDLNKLSAANNHLNHAAAEKNSKDQTWYAISLEGKLHLDKKTDSYRKCVGAAICQEKHHNNEFHRNLGTFSSRKYYFKDDQLEVVYTSPEICTDDKGKKRGKNVTSTIIFNCDRLKTKSEPSFSYKSRECSYLFNWDTDVVCLTPGVKVQTAEVAGTVNSPTSDGGTSSGGVKPKTVVIIISVFLSAIVICVGLIVFHKPERRAAFASRVKRVFRFKTQTERHIKYSMLSQDDEDPEIDEDFFMDRDNDITALPDITTLPNTSTDTTIQTTAQVRTYHDTSDDDMLE